VGVPRATEVEMGEQAKIVAERYPVGRLPEDLRARLAAVGVTSPLVTVTVEYAAERPPLSAYFGVLPAGDDDPAERGAKLRDEWDDRL
jgi:hypothetical protein